jgi:hypothetical protein
MATFTVTAKSGIRPFRKNRVEHFAEAAAQSFKVGHLLILQTTATKGNEVKIGASGAGAVGIVGIAAEDAVGVESTYGDTTQYRPVYLADEEGEFNGAVQDAMALSADFIGKQYGVILDAANGNVFRVNTADTTNKVVEVVKLIDQPGDVNGRVAFKFLSAARAPFTS